VPTASPALVSSVGPSTKEIVVLTAERLFAVHGVNGVSLRQISAEAGMANHSVVQYHFGNKSGLIDAILVNRLTYLAHRRALLFARPRADDLRSVAEAYLLPVMELTEQSDCYYLIFLEQLHQRGRLERPFERLPARHKESRRSYLKRMNPLLGHVPSKLRLLRIDQASALCLHACADRQRSLHAGEEVTSFDLHVSQVLDGIEAFLSAPPSEGTLEALKASPTRIMSMSALP
jgi:AcrR family transcriptional regulator